jgi:phosphatidylglycerol:prolipoprotein diacylglycerol transferase
MKNPSRLLFDGSKYGIDWLQIYWYGALIVLGIIISYILCSHEAKRRKLHKDCVIDIALIGIPLGAIFARLYYVVFALDSFVRSGMSFGEILLGIINIRDGGLAIYGAILGALIALMIYGRVKKMHLFSLLDLILPGVALSQAIGRWGNFFNQEAYGKVIADGFPPYFPLAVRIDECTQPCCAEMPSRLGNIHYATFFYESCWCLVIFIVLWFILRKRAKHRGDVTLAYLIMYGTERAALEGLRTDSLMWGSVRVSQALSILLVVAAVAFIIIRSAVEKKKGHIVMPVEDVYYGDKPEDAEDAPVKAAEEAAEEIAEEVTEAAEEITEAAEESEGTAEEVLEEAEIAAEELFGEAEEAAEEAEKIIEETENGANGDA